METLIEGVSPSRPAKRRGSPWFPIFISLLLHAALLWWLTGKLEASLPQIQSPFVVDLVSEAVSERSDVQSGQGRPEELPGEGTATETPQQEESVEGEETEPEPEVDAAAQENVSTGEEDAQPADPQDLTGDELVVPAPDDVLPERSDDLLDVLQESLLSKSDAVLEVPRGSRESPRSGGSGVPGALGSAAGITGPLGERALLHMELPEYPAWARREGIEAAVHFRFWVSPDGHVIRIETKRRSAYPELESLGRDALLRWQFAPLPLGELREEWGEVAVRWRLDDAGGVGIVTEGER